MESAIALKTGNPNSQELTSRPEIQSLVKVTPIKCQNVTNLILSTVSSSCFTHKGKQSLHRFLTCLLVKVYTQICCEASF